MYAIIPTVYANIRVLFMENHSCGTRKCECMVPGVSGGCVSLVVVNNITVDVSSNASRANRHVTSIHCPPGRA